MIFKKVRQLKSKPKSSNILKIRTDIKAGDCMDECIWRVDDDKVSLCPEVCAATGGLSCDWRNEA